MAEWLRPAGITGPATCCGPVGAALLLLRLPHDWCSPRSLQLHIVALLQLVSSKHSHLKPAVGKAIHLALMPSMCS